MNPPAENKPAGRTVVALLGAIVLIAFAVHWVALGETRVVNGPDAKIHFRWALQFATSLADGTWYPRWATYSYLGLGDPTFLYIHPLFYYLTAAINVLTQDIWKSILLVGAISSATAALATYWVTSQHASRVFALCAALAIAISPYAFHLAHYQQFLPMHFAMPMLVLFIGSVWTPSDRWRIPLIAVSLALLVGSHILVAFMALICTGTVVVWRLLRSDGARRLIVQYGLGVMLGLGLSAAYLLPAMTTQHLVTPAGWYAPVYLDWKNAFLLQYFTLPGHGYRWFHLQWTIPLLTVMACVAAGLFLWLAKARRDASWWKAAEMLAMALFALILGSELTYPLWDNIGFFRRIQFPLRFLQLASIAALIALMWSAHLLPSTKRFRASAAIFLFLLGNAAMLGALERQFSIEAKPALSVSAPGRALGGQPEMKPASAGNAWRQYVDQGGWLSDCKNLRITCAQVTDQSHHKVWVVERSNTDVAAVRGPTFLVSGVVLFH
jgi:hypothetical protein